MIYQTLRISHLLSSEKLAVHPSIPPPKALTFASHEALSLYRNEGQVRKGAARCMDHSPRGVDGRLFLTPQMNATAILVPTGSPLLLVKRRLSRTPAAHRQVRQLHTDVSAGRAGREGIGHPRYRER